MATAKTSTRQKILFLAQFSVLLAIEAIVCFTPLGSLPAMGPIVATLSHVPVILAAILLGPAAGSLMGFFFGLFSFLVWTFTPPFAPIAFVFTPFYSLGQFQGNLWSLVICFLPRILIGLVAGAVFSPAKNHPRREIPAAAAGGVLGTLTNTLLVLGGIWLFFGRQYAEGAGFAYDTILAVIGTTVLTSGLPEAVIGGFLAAAVAVPVRRIVFKKG
ncbi:MAG: ECF transporter S component [Firmicutes bacterium]|nr:ECF transporter S component [Bacillota bacterium]